LCDSTAQPTLPRDAFNRWIALQSWSNDPTNRLDEDVDLAFWDRAADTYDEHALAKRVPAVLERVLELVPTNASVLEVGAGTGAFTFPIARQAARVTALDHSPAMLHVLRRKLNEHHAAQIDVVLSRWEDASVAPHDVAFAANAFYRILDLRQSLTRFVAAARRRGVVVWSIGRDTHGDDGECRPGPDYVHLVDGLFSLNLFAQVEIIERVAIVWWDTPRA
jgi:predicted TPR repeat methyltransferase